MCNKALYIILPFALGAMTMKATEPVLGIAGEQATTIGIFVKDLATGRIVAERNADLAMIPASVTKTVTTASALMTLGPSYTFVTPVELQGYRDPRNASRWIGDIVISPCGDPTIESRYFEDNLGFCDSIACHLSSMGISDISGRIVVESDMSEQGPLTSWVIDDVPWRYGAGLFDLNYRDNIFTLYPVADSTDPYIPDLDIQLTRQSGNDLDLVRGWGSNVLYVEAPAKAGKGYEVTTTMFDPEQVMMAELSDRLENGGIRLEEAWVDSTASQRTTVYRHKSPAAGRIFDSLMKRSDNMFAEAMLRAIAPDSSRRAAIMAERALLRECGLDTEYVNLRDGSGLTRDTRFSPRFIASLLEYMAKGDYADEFISYFPVAGQSGTMKNFTRNRSLSGHIAFKTGSLNGVQTYAGYRLDSNGRPTHVAVVMVNGFFCPRASLRKAIEKFLVNTFQ